MSDWEKKMEDWSERSEKKWQEKRLKRKAEYISAIIINLVLIWVWTHLPAWLSFLTSSFSAVLTLFYISFVASILVNLILALNDQSAIRGLLKTALNIFNIIVLITLYYTFPFDFSHYANANWDQIVRILLLIGIFGTGVAVIVEFFTSVFRAEKVKSI